MLLLLLLIPAAAALALRGSSASAADGAAVSAQGTPMVYADGLPAERTASGAVISRGVISRPVTRTGTPNETYVGAEGELRTIARPKAAASALTAVSSTKGTALSGTIASAPAGQSRVGGRGLPSAGALTTKACGLFGAGAAAAISVKTGGATDGAGGMISTANQAGCEAFIGANVKALQTVGRGAARAASATKNVAKKIIPFW